MNIILPNDSVRIVGSRALPFFYLAGPVLGGGDWQHAACRYLASKLEAFCAALPCRYESGHPLHSCRHLENGLMEFAHQLDWERHYMKLAAHMTGAKNGCLVFWLPLESREFLRLDGNPYAMDARDELGEWRCRMVHDRRHSVVIGAEPGFPGLSGIQRRFSAALGYDFPIETTLEETLDRAIALVR